MKEHLTTVFVVDDDAEVRKSLVQLLKSAGYYTEAFSSADEFFLAIRPCPGVRSAGYHNARVDGLQFPSTRLMVHTFQFVLSTSHRHRTKVLYPSPHPG